jgi:hypothetical protein
MGQSHGDVMTTSTRTRNPDVENGCCGSTSSGLCFADKVVVSGVLREGKLSRSEEVATTSYALT